jgi:hypothetical protein
MRFEQLEKMMAELTSCTEETAVSFSLWEKAIQDWR